MLKRAELKVSAGESFELWARARSSASSDHAPLAFRSGEQLHFKIALLPPYFQHFAYTHYTTGPLVLEWDSAAIEISLFYHFNPASVLERGISFLHVSDDGLKSWPMERWADWYRREADRPGLHFSPFQGWMNDPNGLCKVGDQYHLFYQLNPTGTDWGQLHWGHAMSKDLYHWAHLPVFAHPQQNLLALGATGGAFSGNAFLDRDGTLSFYYTERLPAYDLFKDYKEVQRRMLPSPSLLAPVANQLVQSEGGPGTAHDVRDPKVWFDEAAGLYRMVLGSAVDGDPAILLHSSPDGHTWEFTSVLYRAPAAFRAGGARCAECPDFFFLDGHWVLIAGFVGYTEVETGRHNLLYAITGTFENGAFSPYSDELQELDFGTDYYAMQSFWDGQRQLAFAWLYNWEFHKPAGSVYSGEMSLPRVLSVDGDRKLVMRPERAYERLQSRDLPVRDNRIELLHPQDAARISISGALAGLRLIGTSSSGETFSLEERGGRLWVRVPEDDAVAIQYRSTVLQLTDLSLFFDRGVLEVFANQGAVCGTRRSYRASDLKSLDLILDAQTRIDNADARQYRSIWE